MTRSHEINDVSKIILPLFTDVWSISVSQRPVTVRVVSALPVTLVPDRTVARNYWLSVSHRQVTALKWLAATGIVTQ